MNSINTNKAVSVTDSGNSHRSTALPPEGALQLPVPLNGLTLEKGVETVQIFIAL